MNHQKFAGVYAAAVTPLQANQSIDSEGVSHLLQFLASRGCHGALLLGTTGEGPSFSASERAEIFQSAIKIRETYPEFKLLAGTGTPSLEETIHLTRTAFETGFDGVVVLPPYYYRSVSEEGLFKWFKTVIERAVPENGALFGYHIPRVSGVALSAPLLSRLKTSYPNQFAGLKDSSGDLDHAVMLGKTFGNDLIILNGTDKIFTQALQAGAHGCITAMANLVSDELRKVWEAHQIGKTNSIAQTNLNTAREIWEKYPPAAALLKALLSQLHGLPNWALKTPLEPLPEETIERAVLAWKTRGKIA